MGYIGNSPALKYTSFAVQHFTTSATTSYALDHAVTNENDIRLVINNVVQQPGSGKAYTATGTTLTLTGATTGTDTMYCVFLGKAIQTVTPPVGSVGSSELSADIITGQSALGAAPADTDEFLVSDAGTLKRVDYSYIKGITQTSFSPTAEPLIINGDFAIAQRASAATTITHQGYNTVDRWSQNFTAGTSMVFTAERSTTAPTDQGFGYSWKIDCTTAEASLAATSRLMLYTRLEGQDCQLLKFGTSSAETITLSFWVRSNKTGTYQVNMWNSTLSGYISSTYAISVADTWEKKILTFAGDQNTALTNNNASTGLQAEFVLVGGGNYTGGTMVPDTTTSWPGYTANTRAANQTVNLADSTSNDFYITGVQLEVGEYSSSDLPPFRHESYGDNLQRCERYYQIIAKGVDNAFLFNANNFDGTNTEGAYNYSPQMRAVPSIDQDTGTGYFEFRANNANAAFDSFGGMDNGSGQHALRFYGTGGGSTSAGQGGAYRLGNASAGVAMSSEL